MSAAQYRADIDDVKSQFAVIAEKSNVAVVIPAAMEIILCSVMAITDKQEALKAVGSLRPMIDYMEGQLRGLQ